MLGDDDDEDEDEDGDGGSVYGSDGGRGGRLSEYQFCVNLMYVQLRDRHIIDGAAVPARSPRRA